MTNKHLVRPRIGLLMATRNQSASLHSALSSLLNQTYPNFTLTLINDGSDDQTPELLKTLDDPRLKIVSSRPQGLVPALNLAMQHSKPASYYAVVYASCLYAPRCLEILINQLLRKPKSSGIYAAFCEGSSQFTGAIFREPCFDGNELLVRDFLGPGVLFRAEAFKQAGALFLSEKKGLLETWQRMHLKFGPFESLPEVLLRWQSHPYDRPPHRPAADPEKELYPHLKVRVLIPDNSPVDTDWLRLLSEAGHSLYTPSTLKERPQLILCGHLDQLDAARTLAREHYAPLLLVLNEPESLEHLKREKALSYLLCNCQLATKTLKIAAALKGLHHPLVYMNGMTRREVNRLLSRIPMLLNRHRTLLLLRTQGGPSSLQHSLDAIRALNRPPEFGELLFFSADRHPGTLNWLKQNPYPYQMAHKNAYLPELAALLKQFQASFVLGLDAGTLPAKDWFFRLWPLLADPRVGMVSGHLNGAKGSQNLPFKFQHRQELNQLWPRYRPGRVLESVPELSDQAFLMRKSTLEWLCEQHPETVPLADNESLSHLSMQHGLLNLLHRQTVTLNLLN